MVSVGLVQPRCQWTFRPLIRGARLDRRLKLGARSDNRPQPPVAKGARGLNFLGRGKWRPGSADLVRIIDTLKAKDVGLRILNMNFDTASPTGKMMLTILGSIAEFEREIMLERQKEGIAKAQSEGKYRGRAPTARAKADQVFALDRAGKTREAIAKEVGISLVSVYRILRTSKGAQKVPVAPLVTRIRKRPQVSA